MAGDEHNKRHGERRSERHGARGAAGNGYRKRLDAWTRYFVSVDLRLAARVGLAQERHDTTPTFVTHSTLRPISANHREGPPGGAFGLPSGCFRTHSGDLPAPVAVIASPGIFEAHRDAHGRSATCRTPFAHVLCGYYGRMHTFCAFSPVIRELKSRHGKARRQSHQDAAPRRRVTRAPQPRTHEPEGR